MLCEETNYGSVFKMIKVFSSKLRQRGKDQAKWTSDQWRAHLLENSLSASERSEIEALFARES